MLNTIKNETIKGLLVRRGEMPVIVEIDANNKLSSMQRLVGGLIDCVEVYNPNGITDIIFGDESKVDDDCKPNRILTVNQVFNNGDESLLDVIYGDFIMLCVDDMGDHISLSDSEIERWTREFSFTAPPYVSEELYASFFVPRFITLN